MTRNFPRVFVLMVAALLVAACSETPTRRAAIPAKRTHAHTVRRLPPQPAPSAEVRRREYREDYDDRSAAFARPAALEPQVAFWRNVYTVWRKSDVAIHDNRYLDVVYEIVRMPAEDVGESLTASQKDWLGERRDYWKFRLHELQAKLAARQPLSTGDRELLATLGGAGRVAGASDRVRYQRGLRERFKRGIEISRRYERKFREIFRTAGLPEDLAYLPHVESSFQAAAKSSAGAVGIWQFTRAAAEKYMTVNDRVDERLDPVASARGAARYLRDAYSRLGNWPMALTSYNHGLNGMRRAQLLYGDDFMRMIEEYDHPLFGFASRNFYAEFLAAREIARDPNRYFGVGVRDY